MKVQERRRYQHVPFCTKLTIIDMTDQRRHDGHSIDLCLRGIGFYVERFFPAGARIAVIPRLNTEGHPSAQPVEAVVRWSRVEREGAVVGAEFVQTLGPSVHPELYETLCNL